MNKPQWRAAKKGLIIINTLVISLDARNITFSGGALPTSHSRYYDRCLFMFSPEWSGYTKTAVFWQEKDLRYEMILDETDSCIVPPEVQRESGFIFVGVIGRSGGTVMASKMLVVPISEGIEEGNANTQVTPTIYDQMLISFEAYVSAAIAAAERAQTASIRTPYIGANKNWFVWDYNLNSYVDSGVSAKGEKGENGKDGEDGKDGKDGKDGVSSGDMLRSMYDADGNGIVDNASALGGVSAASYATKSYVQSAIEEAIGLALEGSY